MSADEIFVLALVVSCVAVVAWMAVHSRREQSAAGGAKNPDQMREPAAAEHPQTEASQTERPSESPHDEKTLSDEQTR